MRVIPANGGTRDGAGAYRVALAGIVLLAAACGLWKIARTESITEDTALFIAFARRLADDPLPAMQEHDQHPGFPALLLLAHHALGPALTEDPVWRWVRAGQLVSLLAGAGLTLAVASLSRKLAGRPAALAAAFLAAVCPALTSLRADALSDTLALALLLGSAASLARVLRSRRCPDALLAGTLAGLGYLVRPEAAQVAVVGAVVLLVTARRHFAAALSAAVCLAVPALLLATPYAALRGTPFTKSTRALLAEPVEPPSDILRLREMEKGGPERAKKPPRLAALRELLERFLGGEGWLTLSLRGAWRLLRGWLDDLGPAGVAAVVAGLWGRRRSLLADPAARGILLVLALNAALLPTALFARKLYLDPRHVLPLSLLGLPWLRDGLGWWSRRLRVRPAWLLVGVALVGLPELYRPLHGERRGFRDAAEWLARHRPPGAQVFDATRLVSCLSGDGVRNRWPECAPAPGEQTLAVLEPQFRDEDLLIVSDRYAPAGALARWGAGRCRCAELAHFVQSPGSPGGACVRVYAIRKEARP